MISNLLTYMNDSGHFKRAFGTDAKLIELMQGRASKAAVIKYTRLCRIHIGYQLKTTAVDMCEVHSINYLMGVVVGQDFIPPESTPELP